uniref:Uncharacterized protein n=1 Tax=Felis catus TaxID=9685 RepID=A0ABI7VZ13_FELCA
MSCGAWVALWVKYPTLDFGSGRDLTVPSPRSPSSLQVLQVAAVLKVGDHSGQVKNKCFETTMPSFQNFYRWLEEIATVIEIV